MHARSGVRTYYLYAHADEAEAQTQDAAVPAAALPDMNKICSHEFYSDFLKSDNKLEIEYVLWKSKLTVREARIIKLRFGISEGRRRGFVDSAYPRTLDEVGKIICISKERVRQIQVRAIGKIRRFYSRQWEYEKK